MTPVWIPPIDDSPGTDCRGWISPRAGGMCIRRENDVARTHAPGGKETIAHGFDRHSADWSASGADLQRNGPPQATNWLLKLLHIVTLALHFVAAEMLLGGLLLAVLFSLLRGSLESQRELLTLGIDAIGSETFFIITRIALIIIITSATMVGMKQDVADLTNFLNAQVNPPG